MVNLVMGFATNMSEKSMRIFAGSLRRIYSEKECHLVIITNEFHEYYIELARQGVMFVSTANIYRAGTGKLAKALNRVAQTALRASRPALQRLAPETWEAYLSLIETWQHPHFVRWIAYERFLNLNRHYNQVMIADVKDVVFQAPFFEDAKEAILCDQGLKYGETECDSNWYYEAYGAKALEKIKGRSALCIGTIMGPHAAVLSLARELKNEFCNGKFNRVEQAVFNHLVLSNRILTPYRVLPNITGPIVTLCDDTVAQRLTLKANTITRAEGGTIVSVVHMYDRYPDFNQAIEASFT